MHAFIKSIFFYVILYPIFISTSFADVPSTIYNELLNLDNNEITGSYTKTNKEGIKKHGSCSFLMTKYNVFVMSVKASVYFSPSPFSLKNAEVISDTKDFFILNSHKQVSSNFCQSRGPLLYFSQILKYNKSEKSLKLTEKHRCLFGNKVEIIDFCTFNH